MGLFAKKGVSISSASNDLPVDQVINMKNQGYSNNQIIQSLQRDGFTSAQIFDAMSQAELKPGAPTEQTFPDLSQQDFQQSQQQQFTPPFQQNVSVPLQQESSSSTEELVEAIIDEKWNDLVKDINKIIDWKQKTESKIVSIEQQFNDLKDQFDKLHQALISKIGEYDKNILDVGSEIKAMEKVFSKVLPAFTENVSELSRITENIKKGKK